jgi:hypothetical protein
MLNNTESFDMLFQMMFRCMTEGDNKRCGFVIDPNIHRVINTTLIDYSSILKPNDHPRKSCKYILKEKIINLNNDHWCETYGNYKDEIDTFTKNIYEIYSSNTKNALEKYLNRLKFKNINLSENNQKIINLLFSSNNKKTNKLSDINILDINKGIDKIEIQKDDKKDNKNKDDKDNKDNKDKKEKDINYMEILRHIIPLICLLTIDSIEDDFVKMYKLIKKNKKLFKILLDQIQSWWSKNINKNIIDSFIDIYMNKIKNDKETNQIIRTIKELFIKSKNNSKELSKLIDTYLIPQELEKKKNAEVSTPYKLRQEMLDKIPEKFWTKKRKVFEPCSGKGGFLIDIVDRFMNGLKDKYKDENKRYKKMNFNFNF